MEKLYTMNQIAEMLELSVRTIQNYLKEGKLTGKKIGSQWRFTEKDLEPLFSDKSFLDKKNTDEKRRLEEFLKKDSIEKPEIFSILCYPYSKDFKLQELMKKINENIEKASKCRFYFVSTENTFKFFLEGDIESVINLQKIIDGNST